MAAPLLRRVLLTIIVTCVLLSCASAVVGFHKTVMLSMINVVVAGLMWPMARRGSVQAASIVALLVLVGTALYAMVTGDRLHDDALLIFPSIFLLASLFLSYAWVSAIVLLTCFIIAVVGVAEIRGYLPARDARATGYNDIFDIVILLGTLATFAHYVVGLMRKFTLEARHAHQSVKEILDATSEAIFIHAADDGRIVSVNNPTLEMFGCSREEFLGRLPFDIRPAPEGHDGAKAADYIRRAVTDGPQFFEWLTYRKDGTELWVEVGLRSARIAQQARVIAVVRDITERRKLQQRVREAETFRAVGQLAGGVAHDFNNQLVGILGNAEFLREALHHDADLRECAESVLSSGRRAADLTQQLLAFARKGRRRNLPVDVHQLIREVVALGKRSIDKRIIIEQELHAAASVVQGDPGALQNALLNLLLNSRDALPRGGTVRFRTEDIGVDSELSPLFNPSLPVGRYVLIEVTDDGFGMGADVVSRVFEPFFTTKESGTGMGLAAVHGTVLEHQGAIAVESVVGQGTKFRLCLPSLEGVVGLDVPQPVRPSARRGGRLLVVDDEAAVAAVVRRALEHGGLAVDTCTSGIQALEQYRPLEHDLVLLDVMMPDLDGVEVLRRIRSINPDAKVMLMTGHASEAVEARLREYADVTIVTKPFSPSQLLSDVRKRLDA